MNCCYARCARSAAIKRDTVNFRTALTWTLLSHFEKGSPQPGIKVHLEIRFNFRSVQLDFQSFTEEPVFECRLSHSMILILSNLVNNTVPVVCKLAMKWYLMCMCASRLCP